MEKATQTNRRRFGRSSLKKLMLAGIIGMLAGSSALSATNYKLFVHGRSWSSHCNTISGTESAKVDVNGFWKHWGTAPTGPNVRYVGFDINAGGAYSWNQCGARLQLSNALNTFCTGFNSCEIYTHSTGGLVVTSYFGSYPEMASQYNISKVRLMANASGGTELAGIVHTVFGSLGWELLGGELDQSVSVNGARDAFDHNQSGGLDYELTSGEGSNMIMGAILPGKDDGTIANHSLCGINTRGAVKVSCAQGNGPMRETYTCRKGWNPFAKCTKYHYRWTPYRTVYLSTSDNHNQSQSHHNK